MTGDVLPFQKPERKHQHSPSADHAAAAKNTLQSVDSHRLLDALMETLRWHDQTMHGPALEEKVVGSIDAAFVHHNEHHHGDALRKEIQLMVLQEVAAAMRKHIREYHS